MKRKSLFLVCMLLFVAFAATAQPGNMFPRRTIEERVKIVHDKFDSTFNKELSSDQLTQIDSVFANLYRATNKMREELMAGGGMPDDATREAMREKNQELNAERDAKLKKILSEAQYKKWKEELEPAMMPQRRRSQ